MLRTAVQSVVANNPLGRSCEFPTSIHFFFQYFHEKTKSGHGMEWDGHVGRGWDGDRTAIPQ